MKGIIMQNLGSLNIGCSYKVQFLVEQLEKNKTEHQVDYVKAVKVYAEDIKMALTRLIKAAKKQLDEHSLKDEIQKAYVSYYSIMKPVDASEMYDTYIKLLSQTSSEEITLSMNDANAIINDEWECVQVAKNINSSYSSRWS
jgi:hypothetical protein